MRRFIPYGPKRFAHQTGALKKVIETKGRCALLLSPGLGKTAIVMDYLSILAQATDNQIRVLVLAPLAAVDTWVIQTRQWIDPQAVSVWAEVPSGSVTRKLDTIVSRAAGNGKHWDLSTALDRWNRAGADEDAAVALKRRHGPAILMEVLNLDVLSQRRRDGSMTTADRVVKAVEKFGPDVIVIDESHRIKSPSSNVSRCASRLTRVSPRRIILTGTVMPHSPLDVWSQWRFMEPRAFNVSDGKYGRKPMTFSRFKDRYGVFGGWMNKQVVAFKNLDDMQKVMSENSFVAKKEDCLDLPPVTETVLPVMLSPRELRVYAELKKTLAAQIGSATITVPNRLAQMMRLRQVTSGFLPDAQGTVQDVGRSKVATIASLVQDTLAGERRVVIFAHFTHEIAMLRAALEGPGTRVDVIEGATDQKDRQEIRRRFGSSDPQRIVLIAQTRTMSLAVNELVTASHAIFASLPVQRDDLEQAKARLDRQGQTRPVTIWYAIAPKTVDEVMLRVHRQRTSMESEMLQHIQGGDDE